MFEVLAETTHPYGKTYVSIEYKVAKNPLFRPIFADDVNIAVQHLPLVTLMQQCWSHNPKERTSFAAICTTLQEFAQQE